MSYLYENPAAAPRAKKPAKYRNVKVTAGDIKFDSKREAKRYGDLVLMQRAGLISDLERQPEFVLIPAKRAPSGRMERAAKYSADFQYLDLDTGLRVVEDVKSPASKTQAYVLRRKLMLHVHGVEILETGA